MGLEQYIEQAGAVDDIKLRGEHAGWRVASNGASLVAVHVSLSHEDASAEPMSANTKALLDKCYLHPARGKRAMTVPLSKLRRWAGTPHRLVECDRCEDGQETCDICKGTGDGDGSDCPTCEQPIRCCLECDGTGACACHRCDGDGAVPTPCRHGLIVGVPVDRAQLALALVVFDRPGRVIVEAIYDGQVLRIVAEDDSVIACVMRVHDKSLRECRKHEFGGGKG